MHATLLALQQSKCCKKNLVLPWRMLLKLTELLQGLVLQLAQLLLASWLSDWPSMCSRNVHHKFWPLAGIFRGEGHMTPAASLAYSGKNQRQL